MASIRKRGDSYYIDYRIDGKRVRRSVGCDLKKAEAILAGIQAEIQAQKDLKSAKLTSLKDAFDQIRQYCHEVFAPNTQAKYSSILNNFSRFLSKQFSYIENINDIHSDIFDTYREERSKEGVKPKTTKTELVILSMFFDLFVDWKYLSSNPVKSVDKPAIPERAAPRFLSVEEAKKLLANAPGWFRPILFTFLNTGLRKHELESLEWDDIDLSRRVMHVRHKNDWATKEQEREIPINDGLLKVLLEQKQKGIDSEFVFPDEHRLKYHHNRLRRHLIRLAVKCDMPDVTQLHILRHTFAAQLIKRGVDLNTLRDLLGHNDIKTTMIYSHLKGTDTKEAVEGLEY